MEGGPGNKPLVRDASGMERSGAQRAMDRYGNLSYTQKAMQRESTHGFAAAAETQSGVPDYRDSFNNEYDAINAGAGAWENMIEEEEIEEVFEPAEPQSIRIDDTNLDPAYKAGRVAEAAVMVGTPVEKHDRADIPPAPAHIPAAPEVPRNPDEPVISSQDDIFGRHVPEDEREASSVDRIAARLRMVDDIEHDSSNPLFPGGIRESEVTVTSSGFSVPAGFETPAETVAAKPEVIIEFKDVATDALELGPIEMNAQGLFDFEQAINEVHRVNKASLSPRQQMQLEEAKEPMMSKLSALQRLHIDGRPDPEVLNKGISELNAKIYNYAGLLDRLQHEPEVEEEKVIPVNEVKLAVSSEVAPESSPEPLEIEPEELPEIETSIFENLPAPKLEAESLDFFRGNLNNLHKTFDVVWGLSKEDQEPFNDAFAAVIDKVGDIEEGIAVLEAGEEYNLAPDIEGLNEALEYYALIRKEYVAVVNGEELPDEDDVDTVNEASESIVETGSSANQERIISIDEKVKLLRAIRGLQNELQASRRQWTEGDGLDPQKFAGTERRALTGKIKDLLEGLAEPDKFISESERTAIEAHLDSLRGELQSIHEKEGLPPMTETAEEEVDPTERLKAVASYEELHAALRELQVLEYGGKEYTPNEVMGLVKRIQRGEDLSIIPDVYGLPDVVLELRLRETGNSEVEMRETNGEFDESASDMTEPESVETMEESTEAESIPDIIEMPSRAEFRENNLQEVEARLAESWNAVESDGRAMLLRRKYAGIADDYRSAIEQGIDPSEVRGLYDELLDVAETILAKESDYIVNGPALEMPVSTEVTSTEDNLENTKKEMYQDLSKFDEQLDVDTAAEIIARISDETERNRLLGILEQYSTGLANTYDFVDAIDEFSSLEEEDANFNERYDGLGYLYETITNSESYRQASRVPLEQLAGEPKEKETDAEVIYNKMVESLRNQEGGLFGKQNVWDGVVGGVSDKQVRAFKQAKGGQNADGSYKHPVMSVLTQLENEAPGYRPKEEFVARMTVDEYLHELSIAAAKARAGAGSTPRAQMSAI